MMIIIMISYVKKKVESFYNLCPGMYKKLFVGKIQSESGYNIVIITQFAAIIIYTIAFFIYYFFLLHTGTQTGP